MRAMSLDGISALNERPDPLKLVDIPIPRPGPGEVRLQVAVCGVCHTELDEIEGRTAPPSFPVVPGHEVIGYVDALGHGTTKFKIGDRAGVGWIHSSCGADDENLSDEFQATGRDVNGGYAEYMTVGQDYAYPIPKVFTDAEAAPLLCAGAVGYRALRLAGIKEGQRLGLTGFGGSGHIVLQLARHMFPGTEIFVFARSAAEREFAMDLGARWSGDTEDEPPQLLHGIIDTTPAWRPVLSAMKALRPGGRLIINAIRKEQADRYLMADINYAEHLWMEKELKTVANVTRRDITGFLSVAAEIPLKPAIRSYALEDANVALRDLKAGHIRGVFVLKI